MAAGPLEYAGLFLISMGTLMLEILLTRIFSVTLFNHLAFVAVSIAMFGMTLGALAVFLRPALFPPERLARRFAQGALAAAAATAIAWLDQICLAPEVVLAASGVVVFARDRKSVV